MILRDKSRGTYQQHACGHAAGQGGMQSTARLSCVMGPRCFAAAL